MTAPAIRPIRRLLVANRGEIAVRLTRVRAASRRSRSTPRSTAAPCMSARPTRRSSSGPAPAEGHLRIDAILDAAAARAERDPSLGDHGFRPDRTRPLPRPRGRRRTSSGRRPKRSRRWARSSARASAWSGPACRRARRGACGSERRRRPRRCPGVGLPVVVKASAGGGGGKGLRVVTASTRSTSRLPRARATRRARSATARSTWRGGSSVRAMSRSRSSPTRTVKLSQRECSIERRHRQIVEETPSGAAVRARRSQAAGMKKRSTASLIILDMKRYIISYMSGGGKQGEGNSQFSGPRARAIQSALCGWRGSRGEIVNADSMQV